MLPSLRLSMMTGPPPRRVEAARSTTQTRATAMRFPGQVTASDNGSGVTRTVVVFGARRGLSAISLIYRIGRAGAMNGRQLIR